MARAHEDGKEAYARGIAEELFEEYLQVEERFADKHEATEQEVIDSLRKVRPNSRCSRNRGFALFWCWTVEDWHDDPLGSENNRFRFP